MSSFGGEIRRLEAAQRRVEREAKMRQSDLDRRLKEQAKLSSLEQARLEVEAYENVLEVLLSIHKDQHPATDWHKFASSIPPHPPPRLARHELAQFLKYSISEVIQSQEERDMGLETARQNDEREYEMARSNYAGEFAHWERLHSLAKRVLTGEARAYTQAISEFPNLSELSNLGSSIHLTVHDPKLVESVLKVNGRDRIPSETKSLTAGGKVAIRPMPKARFHEIYQDYVCGCVLRLAREIFALLPVESVILTATVDGIDSRTGHAAELPVLSMAAPRALIEQLDFERLSPSDALENFLHRGDVRASRKSDAFVQIVPLTPDDISIIRPETLDAISLLNQLRLFSAEFDAKLKPKTPEAMTQPTNGDLPL